MENYDDVANADKKTSAQPTVRNVGEILREAREGMGLSVHDIANRIKFAPRQVEALEASDYKNLPEAAFLRGFVRSYARVLQLDEVALIAALPADLSAQSVTRTPMVEVNFPTLLSLQRVNFLWLIGALGVVLLLGLFVFLQNGEPAAKSSQVVVEPVSLPPAETAASAVTDAEVQSETTRPDEVVAHPKTGEQVITKEPIKGKEAIKVQEPVKVKEPVKAQEPVKAKEPVKVQEPVKAKEPVKVQEPVKAKEPVKVQEPVKAKESVATHEAVTKVASSAPATASNADVSLEALMRRPLHFVFGEAMWVEVTDARGGVLLSRNVPSGSEKWIGGPGRAPYEITISNPRKVKVYYKGNPIDLSAYPATETAHLKVK